VPGLRPKVTRCSASNGASLAKNSSRFAGIASDRGGGPARPAPPGQEDRESRPRHPPQGILSPVTDGAPWTLQPSAQSGRAPPARKKRSPGPRGTWPASRQPSARQRVGELQASQRLLIGFRQHQVPSQGERTDGHVRAAVLDHERADQLANPPTCGKCGSPVDRARNRRGRDDCRLHWVCGSQMPNLPSPGSGQAPGQRQ
jgi:hypothetical protein